MQLLRTVASLAVPSSVALVAFLHAHAVGSLIDGTLVPAASIAPFAEARAASPASSSPRSADPILARNPFDHVTGALRGPNDDGEADDDVEASSAPLCDGIRATIAVHGPRQDDSLAALEFRGERLLRRPGGAVDGMRVVYVGADRVWLSRNGSLCQTRLFGAPVARPNRHG